MAQTVPADIAAAIAVFRNAERREARLFASREPETWADAERQRVAARADLDAAILHHLRNADEIVQEDDGA